MNMLRCIIVNVAWHIAMELHHSEAPRRLQKLSRNQVAVFGILAAAHGRSVSNFADAGRFATENFRNEGIDVKIPERLRSKDARIFFKYSSHFQ